MVSSLHAQARRLAEAGIAIFPCKADGKVPATANGFKDASADLAQIDAWWTENPAYNIALCPEDAGWCVIDIDPGGEASWIEAINDGGGHEPTYEVVTPRGGRHIYFKGSLPSTASKVGAHVDTRGVGGYVLVPPSVVNGKTYGVQYDRPIADIPHWIANRIAARSKRFDGDETTSDAPINVDRARDYLCRLVSGSDVARSGHGGNPRTYQVFTFLKSLGISRECAFGLVLEPKGWNAACDPPWSEAELEVISTNAYKYSQDPAGVNAVGSAADVFANTEAFRNALAANKARASRFKLYSAEELDAEPDPEWVVHGLIPEDSVVLWLGPSQSFKSFLLLDVFLAVASGRETFGVKPKQGPVLYGATEDMRNIGKGRRKAWQMSRGCEGDKLPNFRVSAVPLLGMPGDFDEWLAQIREWLTLDRKLRLLAIDTGGKTLGGLNENDSATVRLLYQACDRLREEFRCSVVVVHHSGKDAERGARGSSAWSADFDSVIETVRPDKSLLNVEVLVRKHKNAADGQRWTFKGSKLGGSLVFTPSTAAEHQEARENGEFFAPSKVARALVAMEAFSRAKARTTAEVFYKMGGALGDEAGIRKMEKLAKTIFRPYVDHDGVALYWWFNPEPGSTS